MNQKSNVTAMPIARDQAAADDRPTPFEQAITEVIAGLADQAAADYYNWDGKYAAEQVAEAVATVFKAHCAEISLLRRRAVRGETEAGRVLERARAFEIVTEHVKTAAGKLLEENARLAAHVATQTLQLQSVCDLLAQAPIPEEGDRTVRVADVLAAMDRGKPYAWPAQPPLIVGMSVDDSFRVGWFVNLQGEQVSHLFVGWAVVLHSPSNSIIEPLFRVHGRPVPESQLSLMGWRLDRLR